jgi:hypothetical protein
VDQNGQLIDFREEEILLEEILHNDNNINVFVFITYEITIPNTQHDYDKKS